MNAGTLAFTAAELRPAPGAVLARQGVPRAGAPERLARLAERMTARAVELARPAALVAPVAPEVFAEVLAGEGLNSPELPLARIYPRADRLALYALTLGAALCDEITALFAADDYAAAAMLDAAASAMAENGAGALERSFAASGGSVLAYSPGYCGWHTSGQRRLFGRLGPERIGITLNGSFLMSPVKSVSGVLVAGPAAIHEFEPSHDFCTGCRARNCRARIARAGGDGDSAAPC